MQVRYGAEDNVLRPRIKETNDDNHEDIDDDNNNIVQFSTNSQIAELFCKGSSDLF